MTALETGDVVKLVNFDIPMTIRNISYYELDNQNGLMLVDTYYYIHTTLFNMTGIPSECLERQ